ncbi:hypothetical protein GCM10022225_74870 [Plantactinospora mayteni]|uniref:XRE family transcriptional regulator n=1 Tax=Plantactinospora mayteni TaxID=566021 RepID=A0ABQ4EL94_9ACTN|nr:hypothetical protein [Plantactinospora mayteni]GIG95405.1 hypothetical protein Pma05_19780 [Plantactinospora mayteni]
MTQAQLSRIETGPPVKDLDKLIEWARILRIPAAMLWFRMPEQGALTNGNDAEQTKESDRHLSSVTSLFGSLKSRSDTTPGEQDVRVAAIAFATNTDLPLSQSTALLIRLFLQLDDEVGGDTLYLPFSRYLAQLRQDAHQDKATLAAIGELNQMAGWLALDADRSAAARDHLTASVYLANAADNVALGSSALAYLSLQQTYQGSHKPAFALAQTALSLAKGRVTPLVESMLMTRLARAHANWSEQSACLSALDQARNAFDRFGSDEEPLWIKYVDEIEVMGQVGACYLDLGMPQEAASSLNQALSLLRQRAPHRYRDRVHYLIRLAKAHILSREIERACDTATKALELIAKTSSSRIRDRLSELNSAFEPFDKSSDVRAFRNSLVEHARRR